MTTAIEWARNADGTRGETWNPTTGCDKVSPGCGLPRPASDDAETGQMGGCYAMKMAARLKMMGQPKYQKDGNPRTSGPGFGLTLHPDTLDAPLRKRAPTTYFVNSMSDLFHPEVPPDFIAQVWRTMDRAERHTFQILTKRPQRMAQVLNAHDLDWSFAAEVENPWPLSNVWLGTSIELDRYTYRVDHLRSTPAAVRFLSLEPLLGPLPSLDLTGIDWVIVGAESGHGARPMNLGWVRDIRDRCVVNGVPFFFKQSAAPSGKKTPLPELDGRRWDEMPACR